MRKALVLVRELMRGAASDSFDSGTDSCCCWCWYWCCRGLPMTAAAEAPRREGDWCREELAEPVGPRVIAPAAAASAMEGVGDRPPALLGWLCSCWL